MANKKPRISTYKNLKQTIEHQEPQDLVITHLEQLQAIIDLTLKTLFQHPSANGLKLDEDILRPMKVKLSQNEYDKVWDVIVNTGLVDPVVGFGNSGKLALNSEGLKMVTQYGGYVDYLETLRKAEEMQNALEAQKQPTVQKVKPEVTTPPPGNIKPQSNPKSEPDIQA